MNSPAGAQPDRIDLNDSEATAHWKRKLDCSGEQLQEAVDAVGNRATDVEAWLKGSRSTTNSDRVREAGGG
ncbi:DUF3606 domain-containing protein [Ramlibacter sp. AN1015]|uniref:DUF3606 domain-containing protein n=1 Tax=Ramlibacter sp. AN1015 TaxID=3133428 RepID=UPI0030C53016